MAPSFGRWLLLALVVLAAVASAANEPSLIRAGEAHPDAGLDSLQLIASRGFSGEAHEVLTEDHFILQLFRIVPSDPLKDAFPVLLVHGFLDSSDTWLINSETQSLAYVLSSQGFDVWLLNCRGNKYSRRHLELNPDAMFDNSFWKFSLDQMATFDLPAAVNFVLKATLSKKLVYVGHSQGGSVALVNFSLANKNNVKDKVALFVPLAPIVGLKHTRSILLNFLSWTSMDRAFGLLGSNEFLGDSKFLRTGLSFLCRLPKVCDSVLFMLGGLVPANYDHSRMLSYYSHFPVGTSVRNLVHWGQIAHAKGLQAFDFGKEDNMLYYGQAKPPRYDVSRAELPPTAFFYGGSDELATIRDTEVFFNLLKNDFHRERHTLVYYQYDIHMDHMAYTWGQNTHLTVYSKVVELCHKFAAATATATA